MKKREDVVHLPSQSARHSRVVMASTTSRINGMGIDL